MDLILWRHADAEDGFPDRGRKLTAKGEKQAAQMAAWLRQRLPKDARVISSPARRAQQTAQALTGNFETLADVDVGVDAVLLLNAVGWPDASGTVVVVGHQPSLGRVAALLLMGSEEDWSVKKGGVWWFTNRVRDERRSVVLRAVLGADLV
ncbi:MAG: histidine phosphatase family protein [Sulfuricellaceae bacterium]|nr:histidine phosphatase family protein [Sulfuricellaceae bacterium]